MGGTKPTISPKWDAEYRFSVIGIWIPHLTRQQQLKNELIWSKSLTYPGNTTLGLKKSRLIQTYLKIHLSEVHINVDLGFSQLPQAPEKMTQKKRNGNDYVVGQNIFLFLFTSLKNVPLLRP
jgi:hypothetical protein